MYWCTSDTVLTKPLNLRVHNKSRERERHDVAYLGLDLRTATQPIDYSAKNREVFTFAWGALCVNNTTFRGT
jgi:hypothetical protein